MVSKLVIWFIHVSLPRKAYIHRVFLTNLRPEPRHDLKMHYQTDEPPRLSAPPVTLFPGFIRIPPATVSRREEQVQKTQDTWFTQVQIYLLVQGMSQIQKQWKDRNLEKTVRPQEKLAVERGKRIVTGHFRSAMLWVAFVSVGVGVCDHALTCVGQRRI